MCWLSREWESQSFFSYFHFFFLQTNSPTLCTQLPVMELSPSEVNCSAIQFLNSPDSCFPCTSLKNPSLSLHVFYQNPYVAFLSSSTWFCVCAGLLCVSGMALGLHLVLPWHENQINVRVRGQDIVAWMALCFPSFLCFTSIQSCLGMFL